MVKLTHNDKVIEASIETHGSFTSNLSLKHGFIVILIIIGILLFHFRNKIGEFHDRLRTRRRMRYSGLNDGFNDDVEDGLHSDNFNIVEHNAHDTREGLNDAQKLAIKQIMKNKNISFDEARLQYTKQQFTSNNIDENGLPLDPKTVTLS